jgi:AraC-like DNA-binding protein
MSKMRHAKDSSESFEDEIVVRTFAARHHGGYVIRPHAHDWHQLIYASEGVMWVRTAGGDWVVPPNRAVWVPAGLEHGIEMEGTVLIQTIYLAVGLSGELPRRCCAVNVSPLLKELIVHTIALGMLDRRVPARARLIDFLLDQLIALPSAPLQLPSLVDERAKRAAAWMRAHPDDPALIKQVAKRVPASPRTLERLFQKETGMTFGKWRQHLRLLNALRLLAAGRPVTVVALEVGYESTSAFIAMFRRALGTTPHRYFAERPVAAERAQGASRPMAGDTARAQPWGSLTPA